MSEWISARDRLPEIDEIGMSACVLIYMPGCGEMSIKVGSYQEDTNGKTWVDENGYSEPDVTHWMPLPEPPK
ncbi:DUF551 domain-containing protein [Pseudomonas oryzihabitans]|uniref:DUF551 domain-containing protein n=1 Tax=Pseudomonas oryzihabitans TaxID=47885 RepID=A0ABX3ITJ0_9PSED|nr:DUF551 domain-containing protein [Pseudomonas psychrotolerans]ONN71694.1 hypothetical protein BVL52_08600 [Pseudomonas psychrotolerans]